jgi:hypothetical protein
MPADKEDGLAVNDGLYALSIAIVSKLRIEEWAGRRNQEFST